MSFLATSLAYGADSSYRNLDTRTCPVLDTPYRTAAGMQVGYEPPASTDAAGWDRLTVYELDAWARLLDWENNYGGEFEVQAQWNSLVLHTSGTSDGYPLTRAGLFLQWSQRWKAGYGMQLNATPGLYSALESLGGDDFSIPFGGVLIKDFSPNFAAFAGIRAYPQFDRTLDPVVGLHWSSRDTVVVEAAYPESRLEYAPFRAFRLIAGARLWLWPDYNMGDDERRRLQFREGRAFGRIELGITQNTLLSLTGGLLFDRKISFQEASDDVTIDDGRFFMLGIGRRL